MLLVNVIIFLLLLYKLTLGAWSRHQNEFEFENERSSVCMLLQLFLVMGLYWLPELLTFFLSWLQDWLGCSYTFPGGELIILFHAFNQAIGLILLVQFFCKSRHRQMVWRAVRGRNREVRVSTATVETAVPLPWHPANMQMEEVWAAIIASCTCQPL